MWTAFEWRINFFNSYKQCDADILKYKEGKLQLKAGLNAEQSLENCVLETLNKIREKVNEKQIPLK